MGGTVSKKESRNYDRSQYPPSLPCIIYCFSGLGLPMNMTRLELFKSERDSFYKKQEEEERIRAIQEFIGLPLENARIEGCAVKSLKYIVPFNISYTNNKIEVLSVLKKNSGVRKHRWAMNGQPISGLSVVQVKDRYLDDPYPSPTYLDYVNQ